VNTARLPREHTVEISVRIVEVSTGSVIREAIIDIDKDTNTRPQLHEVGPAVQSGAYEGLRVIWPKE
jgi:hypothetical protein